MSQLIDYTVTGKRPDESGLHQAPHTSFGPNKFIEDLYNLIPSTHVLNDQATPVPGADQFSFDIGMFFLFGQDEYMNSNDKLVVQNKTMAAGMNTSTGIVSGYLPSRNPFRTNDFLLDSEQLVSMNHTPRVTPFNYDGRLGAAAGTAGGFFGVFEEKNGLLYARTLSAIAKYYFYFVGADSYNSFITFTDTGTFDVNAQQALAGSFNANKTIFGLNTGSLIGDDLPFYPIIFYPARGGGVSNKKGILGADGMLTGAFSDTPSNDLYINTDGTQKPSFYSFSLSTGRYVSAGSSVNGSDI